MSAKIGVIGCGWWATRAHLPALQANPDAVIAGIADPIRRTATAPPSASRLPPERVFASAAEMFATPSSMRRSSPCRIPPMPNWRVPCSTRGLHLLLEKPMTIQPPDARALAALAMTPRGGADHRLSLALQPPGPRRPGCDRRRPDRHDRICLLPIRLHRAGALSRQSGALSRHPRLCRQSARPSAPMPIRRSPAAARARPR